MLKKNYTIAKSKALLNRYGDVLVRGNVSRRCACRPTPTTRWPASARRGRGFGMWMAMSIWIM